MFLNQVITFTLTMLTLYMPIINTNYPGSNFEISNNKLIQFAGTDKTVILPDTCTEIDESAFKTLNFIEEIYLPSNVTFEGSPFQYCKYLQNIYISDDNPNYSSQDGVLFDKNKEVLLAYPNGKKSDVYTVPEGVREVREGAFHTNQTVRISTAMMPGRNEVLDNGITSIVYPEGIEEIRDEIYGSPTITKAVIPDGTKSIRGTFERFDALKEITIPESVTYIGVCTFQKCNSLNFIVLPSKVEEVGAFTFMECFNLEYVVVKGKKKKEIKELLSNSDYNFFTVKFLTGLDGTINGQKVDFDATSPYMDSLGNIYVPVGKLVEAFGAELIFDESKDVLSIAKDGKAIYFIKDMTFKMHNDNLYAPYSRIKEIVRFFDYKIKLDKRNYMIIISEKE